MTNTATPTPGTTGAVGRPVIALPTDDGSATTESGALVRVTASDLREAGVAVSRVRQENPDGTVVLLDVDVHLAPDFRTALKEAAALSEQPTGRVRYVGTPSGLAGFVTDIRAAGVADGVVAIAIGKSADLAPLVRDAVAPLLACDVADVA
ncbi:hypothetical protein ACFYVR_25965 [Rhodococcus sp. NPDC003318]|uniref:hypothetical protein n=1 Tax=Rhodococcus sp. NPDC003318 TaxID=3364503 RepID=UPI003694C091